MSAVALHDINASADLPDAYAQLTRLLSMPFVQGRTKDAILQIKTASATLFYGEAAPTSSQVGSELAAGAALTWEHGPGWRIDWIWLKETTAGGGSVVVLQGVVDDGLPARR